MIRSIVPLFALTACSMTTPPPAPTPAPHALMTWDDLTTRPRPEPNATISYGAGQMQKVDVWVPDGAGPFPTVLMVHGGCWTTSIADRSLMDWIAADLRDAGYAVWNIDYRGVDREGGGYPGTFLDVENAADALPDNAARFHLDTDRIVAVGHSAGGHLALWLAGRRNLPATSPLAGGDPIRIDHVISLGGLPDLEATAASPDNGCGTEVVGQLVGPATAAHPDPYADTSVPRLLPLGVPQDLVNGAEDKIIPLRLGTGYVEKARAAGDKVALHVVDQTGHVELIAPDSTAWAEAKRLIAAAFEQ
jgi:acetyl esterase/lipase